MIEVNKFQTQLTDEYINSLKEECRTDLLDMINNVEFIQRLISPNRKYAKDLERDSSGKIKVDLVNPHIITDSDYFRQAAIHFQKYGCYTKLMPNPNPQSEYGQWLKREVMRCWNGMVRESDGEWITGDMYFYLNYFPIIQTKIKKGSKVGERVIDFPEMWEGVYWRFHYWHQARYGGMYDDFIGGKHCIEIASRGRSKSYSFGAKLTKNFVLGENELNRRNVKSLVAAYQKEYLIKDGTLNKFIDGITHCAKYTQFPSARLKASMSDLNWKAGFIDADTQLEAGTLNEVLGVAVKDDSDKLRGKRSSWLGFEEFAAFAKFLETWQTCMPNVQEGDISFGQMSGIGCVCAGTKVWNRYGDLINIEDINKDSGIIGFKNGSANIEPITYIQDKTYKQCVKITDNKGKFIECSIDHPILRMDRKSKRTIDYKLGNNRDFWNEYNFTEAGKLKVGDKIMSISELNIFGDKSLFDARFVGMLIGDGSYGFDKTPVFSNCDDELNEYVYSKYDAVTESSYITKIGKTYKETRIKGITRQLREIGIYGQTKTNKRLPVDFLLLNKEDAANLIGGLFDTDGCVVNDGKRVRAFLTQSSEVMLYQVETLLLKFGVRCNIRKKMPRKKLHGIKDVNPWYELHIESNESVLNFAKNIKLLCKYKQDNLDFVINNYTIGRMDVICGLDGAIHSVVKKIEYIGVKRIYNLTADDSNTYIANGFITHNTGGSSGNDFMGALEMLNYPDGYRVYSLPNYWDKGAQGKKKTVFFYPGYVNSKGYYNEDGVSDVVGALISEIEYRINLKYNSSDPLQLTRRKAETAFTIQDAIMKRDGSLYPTDKLNDVINEINLNPKYTDDMWIGRLSLSKSGEVEYKPDNDLKYITEFPHKDNKITGAICIKQMPIKNSSGSVPWGRYISGIDTFDDDGSDTLSLFSMFILDLWTDELVFEYTGREMFADDSYEIARLALLMYNAECNYENNKKGLFKYFSQHNCLYLLSDTLEFLKDKEIVKGGMYGNKSKGVGNYGAVGGYARRAIRDYLLRSKESIVLNDVNGQTVEQIVSVFNYQKIWSKGLLQELAMWNNDGNYDRHDALAMLMLLREDKLRLLGDTSARDAGQNRDVGYLGKDSFFEKNYRKNDLNSTRSKLKFQ